MKPTHYRFGLALGLLILLSGSILHALAGASAFGSGHSWGNDDAFISYRYAENLVRGNGLVYNRGERVEGYSNFLYVFLTAPAFWLTDRDGVYFFSVFLNLLFATASFLILCHQLRTACGDGYAVVGGLIFSLCLPLWLAVASGLETCLVIAIDLALWMVVEKVVCEPTAWRMRVLSALMILSLVARADGFVAPGIVIAYLLLKKCYGPAKRCAAAVGCAALLYEGWRYFYYRDLLPNTFYVKVTMTLPVRFWHALGTLKYISLYSGLLPYFVVYAFVLIDQLRGTRQKETGIFKRLEFPVLFGLGWIAYWLSIGGDHYRERFLLILFPLGIYLLLKFLAENATPKATALIGVLIALYQVVLPAAGDSRFAYTLNKYDNWIAIGKFIGQKFPGETVAAPAIGKIGFFSDAYLIDMLGVTDPHIAHDPPALADYNPGHMKYDTAYTLSRNPDLIVGAIKMNHDLEWGMDRSSYEAAGYRIAYLVNSEASPRPANIVDVAGTQDSDIDRLIADGYYTAILVKK